jgi:drug/metabolite transporter (DMT)-like permease
MRHHPVILAFVAALLFGAATPASKRLLTDFSVFQLAGLLYIGGAIAMLPQLYLSRRKRVTPRMSLRNKLRLAGAIACGGILGPVFLLFGLELASAASVSLWLNLELAVTALLGHLVFKDHLNKAGWFGIGGVFLASALLTFAEGLAGWHAGVLVALACTCWGFDNHFTALIDGMTPAHSTLWKGAVAGLVNLGIGLVLKPPPDAMMTVPLALLIGAFSYGFSIALYITSAQSLGATRSQMIFASAPFFGVALSALTLGEELSPLQFAAGAMLAVSLALLILDRHAHSHHHRASAHEHSHRHDDLHHAHEHDELSSEARHTHWHEHKETIHAHPHWPDLHHRHLHKKDAAEPDGQDHDQARED